MRRLLFLLLLPLALGTARAGEPPARLQDTGLDGPGVVAFAPRFPLWTDGAAKRRWIRLPAGGGIDPSDADAWRFPPGTTLWKEFAYDGRPVETRMLRLEADGRWTYAVYLWNAAGTEARLAPPQGQLLDLGGGRRHALPSREDCAACHEAAPVPVLGYSAVQLGRSAIEPALGHLHGNCAHCHHPQGVPVRLNLQQRVAGAEAARQAVLQTLLDAPSRWQPPGAVLPVVAPGDPQRSLLWLRMASRDPRRQMPPLGSLIPDPEGLALVAGWIRQHPPTPEENPR